MQAEITYKLLEDGAFVAGDTLSGVTSYAYPGSANATKAQVNAVNTAAHMISFEWNELSFLSRSGVVQEYDAKNWSLLNA